MENKKSGLMAKFLIPSIIGIILFMIPVDVYKRQRIRPVRRAREEAR